MEAENFSSNLTSPYYCPAIETLALEDTMGPGRRGQYCSSLVSVRSLKPEVMTNGRRVREVRIFDDTASTAILKLWEPEQLRMATEWESRYTILLLTNVKIEFDQYWQINVLSGSSRTVITVNPHILDADQLRNFSETAAFSSIQRLETYVGATLPSIARSTRRRLTVADIRQLSDKGASSEATALLCVSVLATITHTNLMDEYAVTARCRSCGWLLVAFADTTDCENFACTTTATSCLPVQKYTVRAEITDPTGSLSDLMFSEVFLTELLGDPETWLKCSLKLKTRTNRLLPDFAEIFLALELPLPSQSRPLRGMVVSAN